MSWAAAACMLVVGLSVAGMAWLVRDPLLRGWAHAGLRRLRASALSSGALGELSGMATRAGPLLDGLLKRDGRATEERMRAQCMAELGEFVDVVALGLSAGVSFDAALDMYCSRYRTMLAARLGEAMTSWQLGMATRAQALERLAGELGVPAFSTFVSTVVESLEFGAPLAHVLTEQAQAIRQARRFAVEEQIEKAPVRMLIPTGTLILPAMLLAVMGPILASLGELGI